MLHDRPLEIDTSLIDAFDISLNGQPLLDKTAVIQEGIPLHFVGKIKMKPSVMSPAHRGSLRMAYRNTSQGDPDWATPEEGYTEKSFGTIQGDTKEIDSDKKIPWPPGEYEIRFYVILQKDNLDNMLERATIEAIHQIARGHVKVLPAGADNSKPAMESNGQK
ncbi:MAG: hypothetical protein KDA80_13535 [Planctomycetaceae bacterium]|nr:hypothetical protein [Planctomycetaceae bacterium]